MWAKRRECQCSNQALAVNPAERSSREGGPRQLGIIQTAEQAPRCPVDPPFQLKRDKVLQNGGRWQGKIADQLIFGEGAWAKTGQDVAVNLRDIGKAAARGLRAGQGAGGGGFDRLGLRHGGLRA